MPRHPHLADLIPTSPADDPITPAVRTCPLTDQPAKVGADDVIDAATLEDIRRQLSELKGSAPFGAWSAVTARESLSQEGLEVEDRGSDFLTTSDRPVLRRCEFCPTKLGESEGRLDHRGGREIIRCAPNCTERQRHRRSNVFG